MNVEREEHQGVTVLKIDGNLNTPSAMEMKRVFSELVAEERYDIVINMEKVAQINYAGVGLLIERLRTVRQRNGNMKLSGVSRYLRGVFRMVGATRIFEMYDSDAAAVASYGSRGDDTVAATGGQS